MTDTRSGGTPEPPASDVQSERSRHSFPNATPERIAAALVWIDEIVDQALGHGWVEVTITADMARNLLGLRESHDWGDPPRSGGSGPPEVVNLDSPSATVALREQITMLRKALLAIRGRVWREDEQRLVDAALAATEPQ